MWQTNISYVILAGAACILAACAEPSRPPLPLEIGRTISSDEVVADTPPVASRDIEIKAGDNKTAVSAVEAAIPAPQDTQTDSVVDDSQDVSDIATDNQSDIDIIKDGLTDASTASEGRDNVPDISPVQDADGVMPETQIGQEALEAAFSLLASRTVKNMDELESLAPRAPGEFRIGVMLPFTGPYAGLGADIANGAELALFQLRLPSLNLIYIDTKAGETAEEAVKIAQKADLDLILGPLFSDAITALQPALAEMSIPALTFTNNKNVAMPNSWVLGNLPEQQIDMLLAQAIEAGDRQMAVLVSDDVFGQRILQHTMARFKAFDITPAELMILGPERVDEEDTLREAIKQFARYQKPDDDDEVLLPPAPYDSLILAGMPQFLLRVAPVLDYYDLGPDRVHYLGTDLWNRPELLTEPSLQDAFVTVPDQPKDTAFKALWSDVHDQPPSNFAKLGFDVLAVVGALKSQVKSDGDWSRLLTREQGFSGFTGSFRLFPDGTNARNYVVKQIKDNVLQDSEDGLTQN